MHKAESVQPFILTFLIIMGKYGFWWEIMGNISATHDSSVY